MEKLWSGRFEQEPDQLAEEFNSSIGVDSRLFAEDIAGSIAHAGMLARQGILTQEEADKITINLEGILGDMLVGRVPFMPQDEDIHMCVERMLTERIGSTGKKLHTGRSRNDQVALDERLYMLKTIGQTVAGIKNLCLVLVEIAEKNISTIIPAYTHLQKAQPSTLAHYMMAYCEMFSRDIGRLQDCAKRTDSMPLGSGALAGTTYPLDRDFVAKKLGFTSITPNSLGRGFRPRLFPGVPLRRSHLPNAPLPLLRRGYPLVYKRVWRPAPVRCVLHRLQHYASEKKTRTWRNSSAAKPPRIRRAAVPLNRNEGPAPCV